MRRRHVWRDEPRGFRDLQVRAETAVGHLHAPCHVPPWPQGERGCHGERIVDVRRGSHRPEGNTWIIARLYALRADGGAYVGQAGDYRRADDGRDEASGHLYDARHALYRGVPPVLYRTPGHELGRGPEVDEQTTG